MSEEARTVWAVTEGNYSDYRVVAIFETKADAEAYPLGETVEEFTFYPAGAEISVTTLFTVRLNSRDNPNDELLAWSEVHVDPDGEMARRYARANVDALTSGLYGLSWSVCSVATTREAAVKAAADRAAELRDQFPELSRDDLRQAVRVPLPYEAKS